MEGGFNTCSTRSTQTPFLWCEMIMTVRMLTS
jgi:hypothetical protein